VNMTMVARPFQLSARWLVVGLMAAALFAAAAVHAAPVGAAVWCGGQYTNYCPVTTGYAPGYAGYAGYGGYVANYNATFRQYTDNRSNCPDGQVTQTAAGYFCTNYGVPAFVPGSAPVYAGYPGNVGYAGYTGYARYAGYAGYAGYSPYVAYRPYCGC
jgi:hypothetical protein